MKRKIILDCDPGIDDAYAILYALAHEDIDCLGISTVAGNVSVEKTTLNARKLLTLSGRDLPIAQGASAPLIREPYYAEYIHGKNGLGDYNLDLKPAKLLDESALEWTRKTIEENGPLTLVAVGPLTNIALLLTIYPHLKPLIQEIVVMGGGLRNGNTSMMAEFNFYVDPEAANIVFNSDVPITMAGLDVTEKCLLFDDDIKNLKETSDVAKELAMMSEKGKEIRAYHGVYTALHDLAAVMYCVHPEVFKTQDLYVEVLTGSDACRGMSIADRRMFPKNKPNTKVILDVDREKFVAEALRIYKKYPLDKEHK